MWITSDTPFNAGKCSASVVGIAAAVGHHDSGMHFHQRGQLLFAYKGCMSITLADKKYILPPTRVAWIPSGVGHCAKMHGTIEYRSIYTSDGFLILSSMFDDICILTMTPLLREVMERIAFWPEDTNVGLAANQHLLAVLVDELELAKTAPMLLLLPNDRRLSGLSALVDNSYFMPTLSELTSKSGASDKTIVPIKARKQVVAQNRVENFTNLS